MTLIISVIAILVLALVIYLATAREEQVHDSVVTVIVIDGGIIWREDFCNTLLCCPGEKHVACNGTEDIIMPTCPENATLVPDDELRPLILDGYNKYRSLLATGGVKEFQSAAGMVQMKWDDDLAHIAGFNARNCITTATDKCRSTSDYPLAGQQTATKVDKNGFANLTEPISAMIDDAWAKRTKANQAIMEKFVPSSWSGSFAMIVHEKNTHIGCASTRFKQGTQYKTYLVCNFAYNARDGETIYTAGPACSKCPPGTRCGTEYEGLCVDN